MLFVKFMLVILRVCSRNGDENEIVCGFAKIYYCIEPPDLSVIDFRFNVSRTSFNIEGKTLEAKRSAYQQKNQYYYRPVKM